jgi:hypothetical protein
MVIIMKKGTQGEGALCLGSRLEPQLQPMKKTLKFESVIYI